MCDWGGGGGCVIVWTKNCNITSNSWMLREHCSCRYDK